MIHKGSQQYDARGTKIEKKRVDNGPHTAFEEFLEGPPGQICRSFRPRKSVFDHTQYCSRVYWGNTRHGGRNASYSCDESQLRFSWGKTIVRYFVSVIPFSLTVAWTKNTFSFVRMQIILPCDWSIKCCLHAFHSWISLYDTKITTNKENTSSVININSLHSEYV